jgi:hypothetical protein
MSLETQHNVLERIFEYLLSVGRKDLVDLYKDSTKAKTTGKVCTARRNWKCCKCKKTILKGTKYYCETYAERNMFISKRYCLECNKPKIESKKQQNKFKFIEH